MKVTLADVANILGSPSAAQSTINQNSRLIEAAIEKTLSRDGTIPNQMTADLDMNDYDIININTLQVKDLTIDGDDPTGILERALAAVVEAELSATDASNSATQAGLFADQAEDYRDQAANYAALALNNFIVTQLSGNGVSTTFPLSGPAPGSQNMTFVFVEGIYQEKDTYSIVGTNITFSSPPPAGTGNIDVCYGGSVSVNTPADTSVTTVKLSNGAVTPIKLDLLRSFRNAVLNPRFLKNTRALAGSVVLTAGQRGHDCWKAGASGCTYTFATTGNSTTITIVSGSLQQVIPGNDLETGTYSLSWSGTAQGRINGGTYSASGVTGSVTGGTNATIEFNTGSLTNVQFELGTTVTKFELRHDDSTRVERHIKKITLVISGYVNAGGQDIYGIVNYPQMSGTPTATLVGSLTLNNGTHPGPVVINDSYYSSFIRSTAAGIYYLQGTYIISSEL